MAQRDFYIVSGEVTDSVTSIEIKGATINIPKFVKSFKTDNSGKFKFALPDGRYNITIEKEGYIIKQIELDLHNDTFLVSRLQSELKQTLIEQVEIIANRKVTVKKTEPGLIRMTQSEIQYLPILGGEKDIIKGLQTLPGVQQAYEGSASLIVRGGSPDQNLYLLDDVKIYNTNHAFGLLSSYNPALIKSIDFYRGGFPSRYSGFISSVLDVKTKDYIPSQVDGSIDLGIISGAVNLTSPLPLNSGIIISARRTFIDLYSKMNGNSDIIPYSFHDYSGKFLLNKNKHKFSMGFFTSYDVMAFNKSRTNDQSLGSKFDNRWGTTMVNITHNYSINNIFDHNLQLYFTSYSLSSKEEYKGSSPGSNFTGSINSTLSTFGISENLDFTIADSINFRIGGNFIHNIYDPAFLRGNDSSDNILYRYVPKSSMNETGLYFESDIKLPLNFTVRPGLRYDIFKTTDKNYKFLQLRFAIQNKFYKENYLKFSYSQNVQASHLLTNTGLGVPYDLWLPASKILSPQLAQQYTLGYYSSFSVFTITVEYFYKTMKNIITYLDGHGSFDIIRSYVDKSNIWNETITRGNGKSNGFELFVEKSRGRYTGWISYTLSWAENQFGMIDNNKQFLSPYDRRHIINVAGALALNKNWRLSLNWQFMSGQPITIPKYYYIVYNKNLIDNHTYIMEDPTLVWGYGTRNGSRMLPVHHLDFSIRRSIDLKNFYGYCEIGCYNIYNRKNPYCYYGKIEYTLNGIAYGTIKSISLFPIIPYFSIKWFPFHKKSIN
jgi:hypothetical protein